MIVINFKDTGISGNGLHAVLMGDAPCVVQIELPQP